MRRSTLEMGAEFTLSLLFPLGLVGAFKDIQG